MVARHLLTASDFTMVRAALVKELKSTDLAVILTRIAWRCEAQSDGWWRANHKQIAAETGLSEDCVQRGTAKLVSGGHLVAEQRSSGYDRTMSYSLDVPEMSDVSIPQNCGVDSAELRDVLLSETTKTPVVDEVVNQTTAREEQERVWLNQLTTPRAKIWTPSPAAAEEVISIAKELDPVEHLVHYRVRCYELDKRPNDREWVRWYRADQQKLRTEIKASSNSNEPEFRDDGTPSTWRNR